MRIAPPRRWSKPLLMTAAAVMALCLVGGYFSYPWLRTRFTRTVRLMRWFRDPPSHSDWRVAAGEACGEAPFRMPTGGYIGFVWGDSFRPGHHHQGLDIFSGLPVGEAPVVAAYQGYLTRLPEWKSSVIIRIPQDPLQPGRQIWTYYTHMADDGGSSYISEDFPPGTVEKLVQAGDLLGYQGNYSGDPLNPVGVHLHFSIVRDKGGKFLNELEMRNTLDPSPYLGMPLNAAELSDDVPVCPD